MKTSLLYQKINLLYFTTLFIILLINACVVDPYDDHHENVNNTQYAAEEEFDYKFETFDRQYLELNAISGSIEIIGVADLDSVHIWGERRVESESTRDARAHLEYLQVRIDLYSDGIKVETDQPDQANGRNYLVYYHIRIPENWEVKVNSVNGVCELSSIASAVEIANTNGNLILENISGDVSAGLTNGNLTLTNYFGNIVGNVLNGNITCHMTLPDSGSCFLSTVNGPIALSIPTETSAILSASVVNGGISITNLEVHNTVTTPTSVQGRLGDGNGTIELGTVNGAIEVIGF
jgi:hypothetical protein